jgi:hypothetical protein
VAVFSHDRGGNVELHIADAEELIWGEDSGAHLEVWREHRGKNLLKIDCAIGCEVG